jgi:outer membrane protein assembly complex protein YaeT
MLAAALLAIAVAPAHADYRLEAAAFKGFKVRGLEIKGLERRMSSRLAEGLYLSTKPALYPEVLEDDIARARLYMARHGYPYASIEPAFVPNEAWRDVKVVFNVSPGPPVLVTRSDFRGLPPDLQTSAARLVLTRPGTVFQDQKVAGTVASLDSLFLYWGYARAQVGTIIEAVDTTSVSVTYDIDAGKVNHFREVKVDGAPEEFVALTLKVSDLERGRQFSTKAMRDAQDNLRRLDLYRRITFETEEAGEDSLDLTVSVATRDMKTMKGTVRYWNDEGFEVGAGWRHRNLFGRGRGFYIDAVASRLIQRLDLSLWWPALIAPRTRESISLVGERQNEEAYEQIGYGVDLSTTYFFTIENNFQISLIVADVSVTYKSADTVGLDVPQGLMTILRGRVNQNSTDDPFNPRRGFSSWTQISYAPEGISDNSFVKWEGSGSTYFSQIEPAILALRLGLGAGAPTGDTPAIIAGQRFYSGGSNSMRGFQRRKLGPKDSAGAPLGGEAKLEASAEVRIPLFWRIWGALFADAGQVWLEAGDIDLSKIEVAVGPGLWVMTPVGPFRFDLGYRLTDHDKTESRWAFHFAVGVAF